MKIETINGIIRLTSSEGMVLTNGQTSGTEVWLSPQDSAENWFETDAIEPNSLDLEGIVSELESELT